MGGGPPIASLGSCRVSSVRMNFDHIGKLLGKELRVFPRPIVRVAGRPPALWDDKLTLARVNEQERYIELSNPATGHVIQLWGDNVKGFTRPDILELRQQVVVTGSGVVLEPLSAATGDAAAAAAHAAVEQIKAGRRAQFSGDHAALLLATVAQQNEHMHSAGLDQADAMQKLGITRERYFELAQELYERGAVEDWYARTRVPLGVFVQLVGQAVPGVDVQRELRQLLEALGRAPEGRATGETLEALGLPVARTLLLLDYLKEREFIELRDQGKGEGRLPIWYAQLAAKGKAFLRGEEELPDA